MVRTLHQILAFLFSVSLIVPPQLYAQPIELPVPGKMIQLTPSFVPVSVKGLMVYPQHPFKFDFLIDAGDTGLKGAPLKEESLKLVKYFLAALAVPEEEMWVNLSPYEKGRIIPPSFGETEMGRDLLAQDYILKQLTASLTYPEKDMGKTFWDKVYAQAQAQLGTAAVPVNTFNKVWIVPSKAQVYEHQNGAFVVDSQLKVMMEEDYLAKNKNGHSAGEQAAASKVVREIIIPAIEQEVNAGEHFANLRQIYQAMVLATWFKIRLKESILGKLYVNQHKTKGVRIDDPQANQKIYEQYLKAFKKGVYNYIKEDVNPSTQKVIPRKYVSGGATALGTEKLVRAALDAKYSFAMMGETVKSPYIAQVDLGMTAPVGLVAFAPDNSSGKEMEYTDANMMTFLKLSPLTQAKIRNGDLSREEYLEVRRQITIQENSLRSTPKSANQNSRQLAILANYRSALGKAEQEGKLIKQDTGMISKAAVMNKFNARVKAAAEKRLENLANAIEELYGKPLSSPMTIIRNSDDQPVWPVEFNGKLHHVTRNQNYLLSPTKGNDVIVGVQSGDAGPTEVYWTMFVPEEGLTKEKIAKDLDKNIKLMNLSDDMVLLPGKRSDISSRALAQSKILINRDVIGAVPIPGLGTMLTFSLFYNEEDSYTTPEEPKVSNLPTVKGSLLEPSKWAKRPQLDSPLTIAVSGPGRTGKTILWQFLLWTSPQDIHLVAQHYKWSVEEFLAELEHDVTHGGDFPGKFSIGEDQKGDFVRVIVQEKNAEGKLVDKWTHKIYYLKDNRNADELPWDKYDVDVVIDATGKVKDREGMAEHLRNGRVLAGVITQPSAPIDGRTKAFPVIIGVNEYKVPKGERICDGASCTSNSVVPTVYALTKLAEKLGGKYLGSSLITAHAFTNTNSLMQKSANGKGAPGTQTNILTTTGAGIATAPIFKTLEYSEDYQKMITAVSSRGNVPTGSLTVTQNPFYLPGGTNLTAGIVRQFFLEMAEGELKGILAVENDLVSSTQIRGRSESSLINGDGIRVEEIAPGYFNIELPAWYDNEWGYSARITDTAILRGVQLRAEKRERQGESEYTTGNGLDAEPSSMAALKAKGNEAMTGLTQNELQKVYNREYTLSYLQRLERRLKNTKIAALPEQDAIRRKVEADLWLVEQTINLLKAFQQFTPKQWAYTEFILTRGGVIDPQLILEDYDRLNNSSTMLREVEAVVEKLGKQGFATVQPAANGSQQWKVVDGRVDDLKRIGKVFKADLGMLDSTGGIDLNSKNLDLQLKRDDKGMLAPMNMQNLDKIKIDALYPTILNMFKVPAARLPGLLGLDQRSKPAKAVSARIESPFIREDLLEKV